MKKGIWYAAGAYVLWGLLPLYWKWLHGVPALQLISHRVIWSCLLLGMTIVISRQWASFRSTALTRRTLLIYSAAAALIGVNWTVYVWAVNAGFVVEASLGYFINPLLSVVLGVVFLRERLRPVQWAAIALATAGVIYLTVTYGSPPWIALSLAVTFAVYGLVKKVAPLGSVHGLALETALLLPPAAVVLLVADSRGVGAFVHSGPLPSALLVGAGVVTTIPLLLFGSAARRIPLLWIGVLQYIAPTLQFLLGVLVFGEELSAHRLVGFVIVWAALIIFGVEGFINRKAPAFPAVVE